MSYLPSLVDPNTGNQTWVSEFHDLRASSIVRLVGTPF